LGTFQVVNHGGHRLILLWRMVKNTGFRAKAKKKRAKSRTTTQDAQRGGKKEGPETGPLKLKRVKKRKKGLKVKNPGSLGGGP